MNIKQYMNELPRLQRIQLEILKKFHDFCETHGLTYVLAYGTLIGALRHDGYIPWDDDIDVCMPRKDFMKFLELRHLFGDDYVVQYMSIDSSFFPFVKVRNKHTKAIMKSSEDMDLNQGIWIDVFPLDMMPKDENSFAFKMRHFRISNLIVLLTSQSKSKVMHSKAGMNRILRHTYYYVNKILGKKTVKKKLEKVLMKEYNNTLYYDLSNSVYNNLDQLYVISQNELQSKRLHKFEKYEFYINGNAENTLVRTYGNWKEKPPLDQRFPHHEVIELDFNGVDFE